MLSSWKISSPAASATRQQSRSEKTHPDQWQPATKAGIKNATNKQDRTEQGHDDIVSHAERNFCDIGRAAGHQNLQRAAIPAFVRVAAKSIHFAHQLLAIEGTDGSFDS